MTTPTYDLIETTTLTSAASSVTFSSITQDYRDLVLVVDAEFSPNDRPEFSFNGSSGPYLSVNMSGNGSSTSSADTSNTYFAFTSVTFSTGQIIMNIMDYSVTDKHKSVLFRFNTTSDNEVSAVAGRFSDTSSVNSIFIKGSFNNDFTAGSTFSLYGISA